MKKIRETKNILAAIITTVAIVVGVLSGCGVNDAKGTEEKSTGKYAVSDKPIELTIFSYATSVPFEAENSVFKEAEKLTGVKLKCTVSKNISDAAQAFQLMVASGNIPDIIHHSKRDDLIKYGSAGAFEPLNDLIDKNAPNVKKAFEENDAAKSVTSDANGNVYFVPFFPGGVAQQGWFIREDWLKKLKLEKPKNVDEYYNVLKAFKEQDPNGNGKQDEIPLFMNGGAGSITTILYSFGGIYSTYCDYKTGEVKFGPFEPEFKDAFLTLRKWYQEGLIDEEIYTRGSNTNTVLLSKDIGGCTYNWIGSTAALNNTYAESIPGFEFSIAAPPKGKASRRPSVKGCGWAISSSNKYKDETMKYFDFWFSPEGERLQNYGIEGLHYDMVDGKPKFKPEILNNKEKSVNAQLGEVGAQISIGCKQDFEYEKQWLNKYAVEAMELYEAQNYVGDEYIYPQLTEDEEKRYNELNGIVTSYLDEITQQWILGVKSIEDTYDEFTANLKSLGADEMISIQQKGYDRVLKK